jgi:hypothetical protein
MRAHPLGLVLLFAALPAWGSADYDPANLDWNGGARLFALGREAGLRLEARRTLDLSRLDLRVALLFLGPQTPLPDSLRRFVQSGGRVAVADDVGGSPGFLAPFGLEKTADPVASMAYGGSAHLPVAYPRGRHLLLWGVEMVVANHPAAFRSPARLPLLSFGGGEGLLYVVREGEGELVALGDPSVLINQMLSFGDNEHFARNLLRYLTRGTRTRPLWVLSGAFSVEGSLRADLRPRGAAALAAELRGLAEDGAFGVNAVGWELKERQPLPGVLMALSVFAAGTALILLATLWGGGAPVALSRPRRSPGPTLEEAGRAELVRLAVALRREVEQRLRGGEYEGKQDDPARAVLRSAIAKLPVGESDPLPRKLTPRRLRALFQRAERVLGPIAHGPQPRD